MGSRIRICENKWTVVCNNLNLKVTHLIIKKNVSLVLFPKPKKNT